MPFAFKGFNSMKDIEKFETIPAGFSLEDVLKEGDILIDDTDEMHQIIFEPILLARIPFPMFNTVGDGTRRTKFIEGLPDNGCKQYFIKLFRNFDTGLYTTTTKDTGKKLYFYYDENDQLVVAVDQNYQFTDKAKNIKISDRIRLDNDTKKLTLTSDYIPNYDGIYKDIQDAPQMVKTGKCSISAKPQQPTQPVVKQMPTQPVVKPVVKPMPTQSSIQMKERKLVGDGTPPPKQEFYIQVRGTYDDILPYVFANYNKETKAEMAKGFNKLREENNCTQTNNTPVCNKINNIQQRMNQKANMLSRTGKRIIKQVDLYNKHLRDGERLEKQLEKIIN